MSPEQYKTATVSDCARWLDEIEPGWWDKIDLDKLFQWKVCSCVLGQLFGDYKHGMIHLDLEGMSAIPYLPFGSSTTDEWKEEIMKRRTQVTPDILREYAIGDYVKALQEAGYVVIKKGEDRRAHADMIHEWAEDSSLDVAIEDPMYNGMPLVVEPSWAPHINYLFKPKKVKKWQWLITNPDGYIVATGGHYTETEVTLMFNGVIRKIEETEIEVDA